MDVHSQDAMRIQQAASDVFVLSTLSEFETLNTFKLRVFRKEITSTMADRSRVLFEHDIRNDVFELHLLPQSVFTQARKLSEKWSAQLGTRAFDIVHVAAALDLGALSFFSFDLNQRKLAHAAGLKLCPMPKKP